MGRLKAEFTIRAPKAVNAWLGRRPGDARFSFGRHPRSLQKKPQLAWTDQDNLLEPSAVSSRRQELRSLDLPLAPTRLRAASVLLIPVTILLGLWLDTAWGFTGIALVNVWVWLHFGLLFRESGRRERVELLTCLALATAGELVLTEGFNLYTYRTGFLPLYVPPGHCLLYRLGMALSKPAKPASGRLQHLALTGILVQVLRRTNAHSRPAFLVGALALILVRYSADQVGALTMLGVVAMVVVGRNQRMYVWMAVLSLLMEYWGTHLGVWTWAPKLPGTTWLIANPPIGVGVLYCALDGLVLAAVRRSKLAKAAG